MLFNSFHYLLFLPVVVLAYWLVPRKLKLVVLLLASYYFYMSWMKVYGLLLLALTVSNYLLGWGISRCQAKKGKRLLLISAIAFNLSCLAIFKYTNFFYDSLLKVHCPGIDAGHYPLAIILPLGISFFVFEFIHYVVDVYRGHKPIGSPLRFGLFAAFFPSQIAGPIKRYQDFEKQLDEARSFQWPIFQQGLELIIQGLFKKVVLGDNLAPLVQAGFSAPLSMSTLDAWACALAFTFQIYFDFSGYTDIGRGSALLMGFRLPENFNQPYLASSLSDFWHRWHISLSTWLRDYLYIPLGGSRTTDLRAASNLLTTMLLGGLWHGASWHFVFWGAYHGLGLSIERWVKSWGGKALGAHGGSIWPWRVLGMFVTFPLVVFGWVLFRADNLGQAGQMYQAMFTLSSVSVPATAVTLAFWHSTLPVAITIYLLCLGCNYLRHSPKLSPWTNWCHPSLPAKILAALAAGLLIMGLSSAKSTPFIYFQF